VRELRGASRTDAGVHARGQLAAFDSQKTIPPKGWALGLSAHLPREIAIRGAARVALGADPRFASIRKRYRYLVLRDEMRDPFWEGRTYRLSHRLDLDRLESEAALVIGTHDFAAFRASGDARTNTIRTIEEIRCAKLAGDERVLAIDVVGTAFLHNMVRILVGTLLDVARGRLALGTMGKALASKRRGDLGITAPAHGLYLEHIEHGIVAEESWP
jgi:tRNA pseudouridine38-40 synthase